MLSRPWPRSFLLHRRRGVFPERSGAARHTGSMSNARDALVAGLPVRDFLLYVTSNRTLLDVVAETASFSLHVSEWMRASPTDPEEDFSRTSVGRMSAAARREVEHGFPLLHSTSLVGLWGALEACIDDLCLLWLQCMDRAALATALASSKGRVGEFLGLSDEDQWLWLLQQLQRSDGASLRTGIGQFESLLRPLGICPPTDANIRAALFRTKAMRNLHAHRAGRADAKFKREWPDHPAKVGQLVIPTSTQIVASHTAMVLYVESVHDHILEALGESIPERPPMPWIAESSDLLTMLDSTVEAPDGAPWSYHL